MKKTYYFNTGVRPETIQNFPYEYHRKKGNVIRGTLQIPFECEDVPDKAIFRYAGAADCKLKDYPDVKGFKILSGNLLSEYAFFKLPTE